MYIFLNIDLGKNKGYNGQMKKKKELIFIVSICVLALLTQFVSIAVRHLSDVGEIVEVVVDGKVIHTMRLSKDEEFIVSDSSGDSNTICVSNQKVFIIDANCPDKICEKTGFISEIGESIICLPHKLVVRIVS